MNVRQGIPLVVDRHAVERAAVASLTRAVIATAMGKLVGTVRPHDYAARTWRDDRDVAAILKAATTPTTTDNAAALSAISVAFLASLVPVSAAADLLARALSLSFDGVGTINVPNIAPPVAAFVGEGQPIPVRAAPTSAGPTLAPFKFATLTTLTGEMIRNSNAEKLVRAALAESVGPALDAALFSADPGDPDLRPPGLLNGIAPLTPAVAGDKAEAMVDDLAALATAVAPVAGNGGIAVIAAPAQAVAIAMRAARFPYALATSAALAPGVVIAIAVNALVSAVEGAPRIDASRDAVTHEETGPAAIIDGAGTLAVPVRSMFQTDSVALRLRMPVAWGLRSAGAVAWMTGVTW